jgi:hypothetical protein
MSKTDFPSDPPSQDRYRLAEKRAELSAKYVGSMITIVSSVSGFIALVIIGSVAYISIMGGTISPTLNNWGGIILGFYFGSFLSLVKDFMGILQRGGDGQ